MKNLVSFAGAALLLMGLVWAPAQAQQDDGQTMQRLGDWEVHYSAFPSTFLLPQIAEQYGLTRSNARGVVNISVLDATSEERTAQRVNVDGYALNDVGQRRNLEFRRHIDGDAIYYITQVPHGNEDKLRFIISIRQGSTEQELTFEHTFYRN
ncbi:DUF4426 domain-containing protein [Aliidiomarina sp. Khilg15.8]